jgi:hypothetical protein
MPPVPGQHYIVSCCSHSPLYCVWGFEYLDLIRTEGLRIGGIDISFPLRRRYPYSILFDWLIRTTYSILFKYFILFLVNDTALNYVLIIPQVIYTNRKNLFQHIEFFWPCRDKITPVICIYIVCCRNIMHPERRASKSPRYLWVCIIRSESYKYTTSGTTS